MRKVPLALFATLLASPQINEARNGGLDLSAPSFTLKLNDGTRSGPIAWDDDSVPPALGCDGTYDEDAVQPSWEDRYPDSWFHDPVIQGLSYFYEPNYITQGGLLLEEPKNFTLRASDPSGLKRIEVIITERNVVTTPNGVVHDDGPTEFTDISDPHAYPYLIPVYVSGGIFSHWEKRLEWNRPANTQPILKTIKFSLGTFGKYARMRIIVEDLNGIVSEDGVYLIDGTHCS